MRNALLVLFSIALLSACSGPVGPIAGGALEGTPAAWPDDWSFTENVENILLETRPADPYSVTLWAVHTDGEFYVAAAEDDANWVQNIAADPAVIISIQGMLYSAQADIVTSTAEANNVVQAYLAKYDMDEEEFRREDGLLFRLSPR